MILPSFHLISKQWRSSLFRTIVVIHQRQLTTLGQEKKVFKQQENEVLIQSQNNQMEITTLTQKGREC
jgi:hypothetical protein